jgi:hypothetical protein
MLPRWMKPVGLGAKRVRMADIEGRISEGVVGRRLPRPMNPSGAIIGGGMA